VSAEIDNLVEREGLDPDDKRTQLRAIERVLGATVVAGARREVIRTRIPVSGVPGGTPGNEQTPTTEDPLKDIAPEYLAHWRRLGYTREQMIAEAAYVYKAPRKMMTR
jgi:hypothetical protein